MKALATAETEPMAQFVAAPAGWITYVDETIDAFGLQVQPTPRQFRRADRHLERGL